MGLYERDVLAVSKFNFYEINIIVKFYNLIHFVEFPVGRGLGLGMSPVWEKAELCFLCADFL